VDRKVLIHVGFPKTGTTFLQRRFFPLLPGARYLDPESEDGGFLADFFERLCYHPVSQPFLDETRKRFETLLEGLGEHRVAVSRESLTGNPFEDFANLEKICAGLRYVFGKADIVVVIRRQADFLNSLYVHSVARGCFKSLHKFLNIRRGEFGRRRPVQEHPGIDGENLAVGELNYLRVYETYARHFGEEKLHCLLFEQMRRDLGSFSTNLAALFGEDPPPGLDVTARRNPSMSRTAAVLIRFLNRFAALERNPLPLVPLGHRKPDPKGKVSRGTMLVGKTLRKLSLRSLGKLLSALLPSGGKFVDGELARRIMALHAESNRELFRRAGLRLPEHGYFEA